MPAINTDRAALPEDLARRMTPTIRRLACRLARRLPPHVRLDDLVSAGFHGLVAAYARFDSARGDAFESYAEFRIRGAMLDELRAGDPLSRDRRAIAKQTAAAGRAATARLGRAPTAEEIAAELGLPMDAYWERASAAAGVIVSSLDGDDDDDDRGGPHVLDARTEAADDALARKQRQVAVNDAITHLPPRLALIVELHFGEGLTLKEIGARLGVTESRVCQLVGDAVRGIRERCSAFVADAHSSVHRPQRASLAA